MQPISVRLTREQAARVRRIARGGGRSFSAVIRDAVDAYPEFVVDRRRDAAAAITSMSLPVDDWDVMKRDIERSRYPELEGWTPE